MDCDERVGRLCLRHGRGSIWDPPEEPDAIRDARRELLEELARIGREIPGDDWVLGQRVRYLGEAERWEEAEALTRRCAGASRWWCDGLRGYVLHETDRFPEAAQAFQAALEGMEPERAELWTDPSIIADPEGTSLLSDAAGEERRRLEERFWTMANPLFLVEGNDRRTGHLARWVAATMREDARNPYGISWGDDLAEVTVRYGRIVAWEKDRARPGSLGPQPVVGRRNPRSRGFVPPGEYLGAPFAIPPGAWTTDDPATEEQYAPPYAPRIEGLAPQVAVFPRGDSLAVVAAWKVPEWVEHEGADPEPPPEGPFEAGLFLVPLNEGGAGTADAANGSEWGQTPDPPQAHLEEAEQRSAMRLDAPRDEYLLSLEALHHQEERAWRARHGLDLGPSADGPGPTLSQFLLVEAGTEEEPETLDSLVPKALPGTEVPQGDRVGVAWEVSGVPGEVLSVRLSLEGTDRNLLRRLGERLRITDPEVPTVVTWSEPLPEDRERVLRTVDLDLGGLEAGTYELVLEVEAREGEARSFARQVTVVDGG